MTLEYQIVNVRTVARKPGFIYATIVDSQGHLCVNATLDYCVGWIKQELAKTQATRPTESYRRGKLISPRKCLILA